MASKLDEMAEEFAAAVIAVASVRPRLLGRNVLRADLMAARAKVEKKFAERLAQEPNGPTVDEVRAKAVEKVRLWRDFLDDTPTGPAN